MPYKSKKEQAAAQKRYRQREKAKIKKLEKQFPEVHSLIWGKKKKKGKR